MEKKDSECEIIVNRERTESESSNHSNPDETFMSRPDSRLSNCSETEDFKVKVNVAIEFKELRKRVEGLQHIKRIREIKAKTELEKKPKKSVKVVDENDNKQSPIEQITVIKTKLKKTRSLSISKETHIKNPSSHPSRKSSKRKSSKKQTSDINVPLNR